MAHVPELVEKVRSAPLEDAGFAETVAAFAAALWRTVRERPAGHRLLKELVMFALRSPQLRDTPAVHYVDIAEVTAGLVAEAAARTGHEPARPPCRTSSA
ncbi:hypothetical protein GCM10022243_54460 [Saccharothrix violaceirubra]|uniref:Uncharacterized protein n=1 Tax=Saccharothrix violaceirubra TaxID=413306 RepID=A0A7W7T5H3_9PSEU|nr:hypothetical protein [Saccharothrix violaceirubra]MBB4966959.1 hypothetical protein [Saccharothrix violaceirubra]